MTISASSLRQLAADYQARGLPAIPVRQGRPLIRWETYQDRLPTPEEIEGWPWGQADGLAIVCGHRDPLTGRWWWVWDIEHQYREMAEAWLDNEHPGWRKGLVAESQRGGLHVYCLSRQPNSSSTHPWGDIKAAGGLAYAPPTRAFKPDATGDYQWLSFQPEEALELEPVDLPGWGEPNGHRHEPLGEVLKRTIPIGARNTILTRVAGWLRGDGQLEPDEVLAVLKMLNQRCEEPLPEQELEAIAKSSGRWRPNPMLLVNGHQSPGDGRPVRTLVTFTGRPVPPPRPWLVADFIPEGLPALLYGNGGSAKSYLALLAGICVAGGVSWLGKPTVQRPVLYADFELDEAEQHRRAVRLATGLGQPDVPEAFKYVPLADLSPQDAEAVLVDWVTANPTGLVVVDSVGAAAVTDQEKAQAVVQVFRGLRALNPGGLLLVDHQSKLQAGQDYRDKTPFGSVYKFNLSRVVWQSELVESQPGEAWLILRNTKNNLGPLQGEIGVKLSFEDERVEAVAVPLTSGPLVERASLESRILAALGERGPSTAQGIADHLEAKLGSVKAKLSRLKGLGRVVVAGMAGREHLWALPGQGGQSSLTASESVNVNDDPAFRDIPHHDAECHETPSSLTLTASIGVNVNDSSEFRDISHAEAKNGGHAESYPQTFRDISDAQAKNEAEYPQCLACGKGLTWDGTGRRPQYCSPACRKRAQRQREETQPVDNITSCQVGLEGSAGEVGRESCLDCGRPIEAVGFRYRCPPCLKAKYDSLGREYPEKLARWLEVHSG